MTPELFQQAFDYSKQHFMELVAKVNHTPEWDIENPIMVLLTRDAGQFKFELFNSPMFDAVPGEVMFAVFKTMLQKLRTDDPKVVAGVLLSGGWKKDPDTMEHQAEVLILNMEDPDRNIALAQWTMHRPKSGPVELSLDIETVQLDHDFEQTGCLQNFYEAPPREPKNRVN